MSRFFKSAAFPILIVVVLAFFISKVFVSPGSERAGTHLQDARYRKHPEATKSSRPS